jgi:hypothetical protein
MLPQLLLGELIIFMLFVSTYIGHEMKKNGFVGINHGGRRCQVLLALLQSEFDIFVFMLHPSVCVFFYYCRAKNTTERTTLGSTPTPLCH